MSRIRNVVIVALIAALMLSEIPFTAAAATTNVPTNFIIGVWAQPTATPEHKDNFAFWKSLGVNTLLGYDNGPFKNVTMETWDAKAQAAGLKAIRWPSANLSYDQALFRQGYLVAWQIHDEPDKYAANLNSWTDATVQAAVLDRAHYFESLDTTIPVFANFMGDQLSTTKRQAWYTTAVQQGTDFYSFDFYPFNRNYTIDQTLVAKAQTFTAWTGRYPLVYIETSDQKLPGNPAKFPRDAGRRGPTPSEIKSEMATAVALGAPGVLFFPQQIGGTGFKYDGMTDDQAAAVKEGVKMWSGLNANPGTAVPNLPTQLIGRDRTWNGQTMRIIVNTSQTASVTYNGKVYRPLEYTTNVLGGGVSRDIPGTTNPGTNTGGSNSGNSNPGTSNPGTSNPGTQAKSATTLPATAQTKKGAVINGNVNPGDSKGVAWFEYGYEQGSTFGITWPYKAGVKGVSANTNMTISAQLANLLPGKTYHYRIMVETATGKKYGEILRFTVPAQ